MDVLNIAVSDVYLFCCNIPDGREYNYVIYSHI